MPGIETIRNISRTYRHIQRYRQIVGVLLKNGFGYLFHDLRLHTPLGWKGSFGSDSEESEGNTAPGFATRLRKVLVELGPTYVKLGQVLSSRPDLLPKSVTDELAKLKDQVEPFPFEQVRQTIHEELGGEIEEFFATFDERPVGSASIAQGHHATLKDGTEVFVKVQRPNIERNINVDLEILEYFAGQLEANMPDVSFLKPTRIVKEFARGLHRELDFGSERSNMLCFAQQFKNEPSIVVPRPHVALCTPRVLTMDFIRGIHADDLEAMQRSGIDLNAVAHLGVRLLMEQIFKYGYFHADPHGGNMFILPGPKICYVDFGQMGRLTQGERLSLGKLLTDIFANNNHSAAKVLMRFMNDDSEPDMEDLERELQTLVDIHMKQDISHLNIMQVVQDLYDLCRHQRLSLKPNIYNMMRALGYADAMGRGMAPDFQIYNELQPFIQQITLDRINPVLNLRNLLGTAEDWGELVEAAPILLRKSLLKLDKGDLTLRQHIEEMPSLTNALNIAFNRLCAGIVIGGMLIASAIVLYAKTPPLLWDISILGVLGYLFAIVLGCILIWSIIRQPREH
ncbi:MAG: AarF/ABC1/UbiB kinase family protein [Victivallales bacterium]|nr:AarF/ABC1/UbiB kinase family protein [Victivallales bacterium]